MAEEDVSSSAESIPDGIRATDQAVRLAEAAGETLTTEAGADTQTEVGF